MRRLLAFLCVFFWGVSSCWAATQVKFYAYNPSSHPLKLVELHKP